MTAHSWQFTSRFRRRSFGWRSATPVQRVKEAVKEIKQVARKEPVVAAYAAVMKAASVAGTDTDVINAAIRPMYAACAGQFLEKILGRHVPGV